MIIDRQLVSQFASLALAHVKREYPNKLDHVINGPEDVRSPRELHPIFYGSFDWHSNVHGYWLLATLLRLVPDLPEASRIRELFDEQFTAEKARGEIEYLLQPNRGGFERPYGWAWLLMLSAELRRHDVVPDAWRTSIDSIAVMFAERMNDYVERLTYPIRVGTHYNTAFALALCLEWAAESDDKSHELLRTHARSWFGADRGCQAWEPGGDDFLSSALIEAECMRRALGEREWRVWFDRFLPDIELGEPRTLFTPATVSDRTDGKIAHLDGLNLSRAWCWRAIARSLRADDPRRATILETAQKHVDASLPHVAGDYAGEHWLATYALLALMSASD
ncbi:MAG TPA: DUF2891 domain-containing protein [Gemmatimonadaceae bacterium]|jgi:hypothetical protein